MKLNCDLGEMPVPATGKSVEQCLMPLIDQASIACGGHAGDMDSMRRCVELALRHQVSIGAHPSYPDREHFGRQSLAITAAALCDSIVQQIEALQAVCAEFDTQLAYVKPHGALYNDMAGRADICACILQAMQALPNDVALMHFAGLDLPDTDRPLIAEAFVDRRYTDDGQLQSRAVDGAVLTQQAMLAQAEKLARYQHVISVSGNKLPIQADSLCVHGDNPAAADSIQQLRNLVQH